MSRQLLYSVWMYICNIIFHNCIVCFFVVLCWQGSWTAVDYYVFPSQKVLNSSLSLGLGILVTLTGGLIQEPLKNSLIDKSAGTFFIVSRMYTYVMTWGFVLVWRGTWNLLDVYTGISLTSALTCAIVSITLLAFLRTLKSILAPPVFADVDIRRQDYFRISSRFSIKPKRRLLYICDIVLVSVFIYPTVVVFWRGAWTTMDLLLPSYTPTSIIYTVVIFSSSELLYIILSYPILNLFKKIQNHRTLTICIDNALTLYLGVTCVAGWRCIWKTVTFYYLPNHPQIASWSAHGIGYIVLTASLVGNALLARGCKVDGRPIEDGTGLYMTSIIEQLVRHCKRTATDDREIKPESITYI